MCVPCSPSSRTPGWTAALPQALAQNDGCFVAAPAVSWQMRSNCSSKGGQRHHTAAGGVNCPHKFQFGSLQHGSFEVFIQRVCTLHTLHTLFTHYPLVSVPDPRDFPTHLAL